MSWRNFKNSRFKEKTYQKSDILTSDPNDNNDKRKTFVTFVNNVIECKTEKEAAPVVPSAEESEAARAAIALKVVKKLEEEHTKIGGVPYSATPEITDAEKKVCLMNQEVLAGRATNQDFQVACDDWLNTAIFISNPNDNSDNNDKSINTEQTQGTVEEKELLDWFDSAELPTHPFDLDCARQVLNPVKFYASLHQEIESRLSSPRWRCGATQSDLRRLRALCSADDRDRGAK